MSVDWNDPETAKIAVEGRRQAILKRKLEAVELFNHNRRLGKPPSLDTLCFAVTEAGCDRSIVFDTLLTTNIWSNKKRARYSETLHQWCDTQMEADNPKGLWLFQKLEESRIFRNRKEEIGGREACLYLEFGNYDGGPQDQLIVNDLEWNKPYYLFGWFTVAPDSNRFGIHGVKRDDLEDYWRHFYGTRHLCKGTTVQDSRSTNLWLDMWIPQIKEIKKPGWRTRNWYPS
ncbi:hypothetical protein ACJBU6_03812 [Exserohilum turcicum]